MRTQRARPILMLGESDVGKTHYGGQLLKRLMNSNGQIRMDGAATNLEPFQTVMDKLNEGKLADHTVTTIYNESIWPIIGDEEHKAHLVWPDYGGEQIQNIVDDRRIPNVWRMRIIQSPAWLLLIRPQKIRMHDDIFSRPLVAPSEDTTEARELDRKEEVPGARGIKLSDQARLIELLQMLVQISLTRDRAADQMPRILILLTCWDELNTDMEPLSVLREYVPMFHDFMLSNWKDLIVLGLSSLGRRLHKTEADADYVARGSENFGYVVLENGTHCNDLTLPIKRLLF